MNEDQGGPVEETRQWTAADQKSPEPPFQFPPDGPLPIQNVDSFRLVMQATIEAFRSLPVVTFADWLVEFNLQTIARGFKEMPEAIVLTTFRDVAMRLLREQMSSSWGYADVVQDKVRAWVPAEMLIEANTRAERFRAVLQASIQGLINDMGSVEKEQAYRGVPLAQTDKAGGAMAMNQAKSADPRARQSAPSNPGTAAGRQYFPAEGGDGPQIAQGLEVNRLQPSIAGARGLR